MIATSHHLSAPMRACINFAAARAGLDRENGCRYTYPMAAFTIHDDELQETAECLCFASRRAARTITRAYERELRAHGIRATQFSLLAVLSLKGPQTIGDLANMLAVDRTTLSRNLDVVDAQGLVRLRPGKDARARIVTLTPKGRTTLKKAMPAWRKVQMSLTDELGTGAANSLRRLSRAASA